MDKISDKTSDAYKKAKEDYEGRIDQWQKYKDNLEKEYNALIKK